VHTSTRGLPGTSIVPPRKCRRKGVWISLVDQKRGFVRVLWYQNMSRVCPGCHLTAPRKEGRESWIREAYGERETSNLELRTSNVESDYVLNERPMRENHAWTAKPPKATLRPPSSHLLGRGLRPSSHPEATLKPSSSHPQATFMRPSCDPQATPGRRQDDE